MASFCFLTVDSAPACVLNQVQDVGYFTVFIPDCNENGDYNPVQCDYRYGYCWCSDENGNPVPGTTVRGKANCTAPGKPVLFHPSRECNCNLLKVLCHKDFSHFFLVKTKHKLFAGTVELRFMDTH